MTSKSPSSIDQLLSNPPLLITESKAEYAKLHADLMQEIRPNGVLEKIFVADLVNIVWEILRLRRCKNAIINMAFIKAVHSIIYKCAGEPSYGSSELDWVHQAAIEWFTDPKTRKEVQNMIGEFQLDESVIEAEAIRSKFSELETLDRMLTLLEGRMNKALRSIADYRGAFVDRVKEASSRIVEAPGVIQLEKPSAKKSA